MLELSEIQAIVTSGFGHLPHAQFLFLAVADRKASTASAATRAVITIPHTPMVTARIRVTPSRM